MTVVNIKRQHAEKISHEKKTLIWRLQKLLGSNSAWK